MATVILILGRYAVPGPNAYHIVQSPDNQQTSRARAIESLEGYLGDCAAVTDMATILADQALAPTLTIIQCQRFIHGRRGRTPSSDSDPERFQIDISRRHMDNDQKS
jgi:hypothetical protein